MQRNAGKPDRRRQDEEGHFIAVHFNGPREAYNHFAQNRHFNRSAYRKFENTLARGLRKGERMDVRIGVTYSGRSKRPAALRVAYRRNAKGFWIERDFPNKQQEK